MKEKKALFLDFDGVLFDTLKEAYLICRSAYADINIDTPIDKNEYKRFYKFKFLVYNSWQYFYLMKTLLDTTITTDKAFINRYLAYLEHRDIDLEQEFDNKYYSIRSFLKKEHFEFWDKLEEPFEFFFEVKKLSESTKIDVVIVSKKDFNSIKYRLNQYGLNLSDNKIYAKEYLMNYPNKSDFINEYMQKYQIKKAVFVDDNTNNLSPCKNIIGLETVLAGWGNIAIDEKGLTSLEIVNKIKSL